MVIRAIAVSALAITASGCAYLNTDSRVYKDSSLFVWDSDYSAGVGTKGGICVQAATTMTASNLEANIAASNEIMRLAVPTLQAANEGELIDLGMQQTQTVAQTNVSTAQTSFANIAFFYLCQVSLNRALEEDSIVQMWRATTEALPTIGQTSGTVTQIKSDQTREQDGHDDGGAGSSAPGDTGSGSVTNDE